MDSASSFILSMSVQKTGTLSSLILAAEPAESNDSTTCEKAFENCVRRKKGHAPLAGGGKHPKINQGGAAQKNTRSC